MKKKLPKNCLEDFLLDSWRRFPEQFKGDIRNLEFTVEEERKDHSKVVATFWRFQSLSKIAFYRKIVEKAFQAYIDKILIHELAHYFGFDEKKAQELMNKKKLNEKTTE